MMYTPTPIRNLTLSGADRVVPVYQRIENDLRRRISQGVWSVGVRLPSRQRLAREYAVDVSTVQKAIASLLADGTLRADNGRGTFVENAGNPAGATESFTTVPVTPILTSPDSPDAVATVGILAEFGEPAGYWQRIILHSLERSVGADNGSTRFFDLRPTDAPGILLADGMETLLREESRIGALVVIAIHETMSMDVIGTAVRMAQAANIPIVFVTTGPIAHGAPHVFYDQEMLGFQAAEHLLQAGASRLLVIAPFPQHWSEGRVAGALNAVRTSGLPDSVIRVYPDEEARRTQYYHDSEETGYRMGLAAIEREAGSLSEGLLGVVGVNDKIARGFLRAANEAQWQMGIDYLLIGFDDDHESRQVGLTTLHPPLEALGTEAGRLAMAALRGGDQLSQQVRLRSHLVPRLSTVPRREQSSAASLRRSSEERRGRYAARGSVYQERVC